MAKKTKNPSVPSEPESVYQLKVTLDEIRPLIWRRIQVRGDISLFKLHKILQEVMFAYEYDFGDSWYHTILVEKIFQPKEELKAPICLKGKRSAPQEDCGGTGGYTHVLRAFRNPKHPDHEDIMNWLEEGYDPEHFNVDEVNERLMKIR
jgi:hypothetical protein